MPPVDPTDLLKAFRPLLTVLGGIKSKSDVPRLSALMKKYSRKLVSRCIYCNILLATTPDVLLCFLEGDGWDLINSWLKESLDGENDQFICELLDLLVRCPMNIERLKQNDTPKLVKNLSKISDGEVSDKAKLVVSKWTELIKPNENVNNSNVAKKKRKKEKSIDDDDGETASKISKVKGNDGGILVQQQASSNDNDGNSPVDVTMQPVGTSRTAEDTANGNRPRTTAKVKYGKSRSDGILEQLTAGKSKKSKLDKSGPGNKLNNPTSVSSCGQPDQSKISKSSTSKPALKESIGFIEDIVNLSSQTGQVRKRRKSDSRSKSSASTSGINAAKDTVPDSSNQDDEPGQESIEINDDTSDDMEEERIALASGDDSNSNTNSITNINTDTTTDNTANGDDINSNNNDENDATPIVIVPEADNLVIPEIDSNKLTAVKKSILSCGNQATRAKKSVRWKPEDRLKEIKFFELDETERTNVSKSNFGDFRANDIKNERQMLQQLRNNRAVPGTPTAVVAPTNDKCITHLPWKLILIDLPPGLPLVEAGVNSEQRRILAAAANNVLNVDFFPAIRDSPNEYYPREPDLMESGGDRNDGPPVIPLEDENFTVTDFSSLPPPQPRTGELYPANSSVPVGPLPGVYPRPGMGPRQLNNQMGRPSFPPSGYGPPPGGYPPFSGPGPSGSGGPGVPSGSTPGSYQQPVGGPRMAPRSGPSGPPGPPGPGTSFQPGPGAWHQRPRPPPICRYFLKSGTCRYQARCNYLHQYPSTNNSGSGSSSNQSHME